MTDPALIWSYLTREPLLWLTATLVAYWLGDTASRLSGRKPLVNPVLISVVLLGVLLSLTGTSHATYFEGAQFVHFMLGPATVALALPLYANLDALRRTLLPMMAALAAGSMTAVLTALGVAKALGLDASVLAALAPKSATAPVAIGIAERLGGATTLAAAMVITTGIFGAVAATPLLNVLGIRDWRARGFAVGVAAHGVGTARAFQVNQTAGAFAGVGMGLNAVLTALIAPWALSLFL